MKHFAILKYDKNIISFATDGVSIIIKNMLFCTAQQHFQERYWFSVFLYSNKYLFQK